MHCSIQYPSSRFLTQELKLTPKIMSIMRQQLAEWTESELKELTRKCPAKEQQTMESQLRIAESKAVELRNPEVEVKKEYNEDVQERSTEKKTENVVVSKPNLAAERAPQAGKETKSRKNRCHRRQMEVKAREEGELDNEEGMIASLVHLKVHRKGSKKAKRVFSLGLS